MKRCCLFFLAFVASVFLAVLTGSFENRPDTLDRAGDASEVSLATREKGMLPARENVRTTNPKISKKQIP